MANLYDPEDGRLVASFPTETPWWWNGAFTKTGDRLAFLDGPTLIVADAVSGEIISRKRSHGGDCLAIDPTGRTIALGQMGGRSVILLSGDTLVEESQLRHAQLGPVVSLHWSQGGRLLTTLSDDRVMIWDMATKYDPAVLFVEGFPLRTVLINTDRKHLALSSPSEVALLDFGETVGSVLRGHRSYVYHVQFSPGGGLIASSDFSGEVRLWDAESGRAVGTLEVPWYMYEGHGCGLGWTSDGLGVAPAFVTWSALSGWEDCPTTRLELARKATGGLRIIGVFRPRHSQWITLSRADRIDVVDIASGKTHFSVPPIAGLEFAVSPDIDQITFKRGVYDLKSGDLVSDVHNADYAVDVSPDGSRIACAMNDSSVRLLDAVTRKKILELRGHTVYVMGVSFSPDGTRLASAGGDGTVRLWDTRPRRERLQRIRQVEQRRARIDERFDELLESETDLESALGAFIAQDHPSIEELAAARDVVLLRALKTQEPPGLHDLPASGSGVVARYKASTDSGGLAPDPRTAEGGGWYWAQSNEGMAVGPSPADDGQPYWRISANREHVGGHYAGSLTDSVAQAAVEFGWRVRMRVRLNAGDEDVHFKNSLLIDEKHRALVLSCTDGGQWRGPWPDDGTVVADCASFHDIEWSYDSSNGTAQLSIDGIAVSSGPLMRMATYDVRDNTTETFLRGSYTDAVVFGIQRGPGGERSVDVQSFEFMIPSPQDRLNTDQ